MNNRHLYKAHGIGNEEWIYGYYYVTWTGQEHQHLIVDDYSKAEILPETLCHCTAASDMDSALIFENDIVSIIFGKNVGENFRANYKVVWDSDMAAFALEKGGKLLNFMHVTQNKECCKIIGNAFDNPELLKSLM